MPNVIEYASVFQTELDAAAVEGATSGWMEVNEKLIKYEGGADVKIPDLTMDGLGDYDRNEGFADGDVNLKYETKTMNMDRGRRFTFDENEVSESNFLLTASSVMGKFQRDKLIPEIDAYRYSSVAAHCIAKGRASGGYVATESTVLQKLYYDIAAVREVVGDIPLVITINLMIAAMLSMNDKISKKMDVTDFSQGDVTLKVKSLDGMYPLIPVGTRLLKTEYLFRDGRTTGQEKGGFEATADAKDVNWQITPRDAPIAVSRTDKMRIFDPETFQKKRAWAIDYRKYHDIWIPDNKVERCFINCKQALV